MWIKQNQKSNQKAPGILGTAMLSHVFCLCSCTWVSLWVPEEKMAWNKREKQSSFPSSHSTCCWRVSAPHSLMCRTLSSSTDTCESPNWNKSHTATLIYLTHLVFNFRLAFFELTFQFCTTQQLQWEVIRHYSKQVTHAQRGGQSNWETGLVEYYSCVIHLYIPQVIKKLLFMHISGY